MKRQLQLWVLAGVAIGLLGFATPVLAGYALQLGLKGRTIKVTPEYREAVLQASLPLFSDFAQRLQLPLPHPLTRGDVVEVELTAFQRNDGAVDHLTIKTKGGFYLSVYQGIVRGFRSPNSYTGRQQGIHGDPRLFGTPTITEKQAVQSARDWIQKAGIPLEDVFAEQEPRVTIPTTGTNTVDRYLIDWRDPRGGDNAANVAKVEINGKTGGIEYLWILPIKSLQRSLTVSARPPKAKGMFDDQMPPSVNPAYASQLIPMMLASINQYAQKLALPIPDISTNSVDRIEIHDNGSWPDAQVELTNGWRFVYRHTMVNGFYGPDNFFDSDNRAIRISDFAGKWNLSTNQAIDVVRRAMAKLAYATNLVHMDFAPSAYAASVAADKIPRLRFEWYYSVHDELQSRLEAEVNMESGKLESLYYDDKAYWGAKPPITVPISTGQQP